VDEHSEHELAHREVAALNFGSKTNTLSRSLTSSLIYEESSTLISPHFAVYQRKSTNAVTIPFPPTEWYVDDDTDQLYSWVCSVYAEVGSGGCGGVPCLENAGRATQYLMWLGDGEREGLGYDEVFALYLIDLADTC